MATYVNNLRLKEISTGDESGTWGTSTNLNLELIGKALGYATQAAFGANADATTTVLDGADDPARAMYFKVTSGATLTATRTLTIAPSTMSRVMFIENATTGSQAITISQGSGAKVTISSGKTKVVYLDGAGGGAAVVDAFSVIEGFARESTAVTFTTGTFTQVDLTAQGDLRLQDSSGGQYAALQAPATIGTSYTLTLPADDGDNLQVLQTNGSGVLDWATVNTPGGTGTFTQVDLTAQGDLRLQDSSGGQYVAMQAPATISASYTLTLPADDGDNLQFLQTNGSGVLDWVDGYSDNGVELDTTVRTSAFTAVAGNTYMVNTSSGSFNITLPSSPTVGHRVGFMDVNSTFDVNSATLLRNGVKLFNATADGAIDIKGYAGTLVYTGTTYGWMPMS